LEDGGGVALIRRSEKQTGPKLLEKTILRAASEKQEVSKSARGKIHGHNSRFQRKKG
jgi:hypothetical protein